MEDGTQLPDMDEEGPELEWLALTERAAEAFCDDDRAAALDQWLEAVRISATFHEHDPRRACSLNNSGVALVLQGDRGAARATLGDALSAWDGACSWVADMALQPRARSSLHHMRMELQHRDRYDGPARKRFLLMLEIGRAATLSNLGGCLVASGQLDDGLCAYRDALAAGREAGEEGESVVRFIERGLAFAIDSETAPKESIHYEEFASQAGEQGWLIDLPPVMTDEGRLMAAVHLAVALGEAETR